MRDFKGMKRQRGRNRKPSNQGNSTNPNRSWDSQGPENIKVRGNAQTVYERYQQLARDAASSGDRVLAENYLQHAEHYFRVLRALQPQRSFQEIAQREQIGQGFDIDFEDESGAQAAAFLAAQQAADRQAQQGQGQGQGQGQPQPGQNGQNGQNGQPGETEARDGEGGRRESRRERWERRRDGRRGQYERDESEGGAGRLDEEDADRPVDAAPEQPAEPEQPRRRARAPAARDRDDAATDNALPGFLTRPTPTSAPAATLAEAAPADEPGAEKPAARRRAPRRKATDAPVGEDV